MRVTTTSLSPTNRTNKSTKNGLRAKTTSPRRTKSNERAEMRMTTSPNSPSHSTSSIPSSLYGIFVQSFAVFFLFAYMQLKFITEIEKLNEEIVKKHHHNLYFHANHNNDNSYDDDDDEETHNFKEIVEIFRENSVPCANQTLTPDSKVDIVIPWINYTWGYFESHETPFDFGDPIPRLFENTGLRRSPYTEICYTIRSHLYNDVNNQIGNIYVVYNGYRHLGPISCGFNLPGSNETVWPFHKVKFMPQQTFWKDVPVLNHPNMSSPRPDAVLAHVHRIPHLRPYFLFVMDDIFLLKNLDLGSFYDFTDNQILSHMTGGIRSPESTESLKILRQHFGPKNPKVNRLKTNGLHVPFMLQKCRLQEMEEIFGPSWNCEGSDAFHLCTYENVHFYSMMENYQILVGAGRNEPAGSKFTEIHIGRKSDTQSMFESRTSGQSIQWVDIQGDGISDEYVPADIDQDLEYKAKMLQNREIFDDWLQQQPFYYYFSTEVKRNNSTTTKDEERIRAKLLSEAYKQNHTMPIIVQTTTSNVQQQQSQPKSVINTGPVVTKQNNNAVAKKVATTNPNHKVVATIKRPVMNKYQRRTNHWDVSQAAINKQNKRTNDQTFK